MINLDDYVLEHIDDNNNSHVNESEKSIKSEKDFRAWAEAKFKEVFGDEYNADEEKKTVDGFLNDHKDDVDAGDWGKLVGEMNKSFAS